MSSLTKATFILLTIFTLSCRSTSEISLNGLAYENPDPPNCVKISENFYADETELSNIDWKEYLFWLSDIYGSESQEYYDALPDTLVHREDLSYGEPYVETYFKHPSYDRYPVVGLNLNQAKNYSNWRTERVAEMMLIQKGLIKVNPKKDPNSIFTIQRYQEGEFDWIIKKETIALPIYTIPTKVEWEDIAGIDHPSKYGIDSLSRKNKKYLKKGYHLYLTKTKKDNTPRIGNPVRAGTTNVNGLYATIGNVAELIQENLVKGGSYKDNINNIEITKNVPFEKPTSWIGFRNVCRYQLIEIGY